MLKHVNNFIFKGEAYPENIGELQALYEVDTEDNAKKFYNELKQNGIARSIFISGGKYYVTKLINRP